MNTLIIEDEIPAFEKLRTSLSIYFKDNFGYDWARSVGEARHFLNSDPAYELIISDIQLLDGISFEIFENCVVDIPIIFCSAFDDYLFKAFKSNGIAYILKPYEQKDIEAALVKYETLFKHKGTDAITKEVAHELIASLSSPSQVYKERFVIKSKKGIQLIATDTIAMIEAEGDFCKLIDNKGKTYLYSQNIGTIYTTLNPLHFFRINRSHLVQLKYIQHIENHFKNRLVLTIKGVGHPVKTSSSTTAAFRLWLDK